MTTTEMQSAHRKTALYTCTTAYGTGAEVRTCDGLAADATLWAHRS